MMVRALERIVIVTLLQQACVFINHQSFRVLAQNSTTDPDLVTRPSDSIDFPGCFQDIANSDKDGDGYIRQNEYLTFVQTYGKRICFSTDALTLQQSGTFNYLACICRQQEGQSSDCCLGANAKISTAGADETAAQRTPIEQNYLTTVCKLTDATIDAKCPPVVADRGQPAVIVENPNGTPVASSGNGKDPLPWWAWLLIAAAILFLLCCCCGFALGRRRKKDAEEEQEAQEVVTTMNKDEVPYMDPEQAATLASSNNSNEVESMNNEPAGGYDPRDVEVGTAAAMAPVGARSGARGATEEEDSDDEEDVRKKLGGGRILEPDDDELVGYRGAPRIPPPEDPPQKPLQLRPIPPKDEEDDEWDQPGRNIEYPVEKDDMSAGEVDHYEPDGGVYMPQRPTKDPLYWKKDWNRARPDDPDDIDKRKHRIQSGLGEGAVWDHLDESFSEHFNMGTGGHDVDWVMASALGALDTSYDDLR